MAKTRRNVQQGFFDGSGFHPIRASKDYDSSRLFDDTEGGYKKKKKSKSKKRKNPSKVKRFAAKAVSFIRRNGQTIVRIHQ